MSKKGHQKFVSGRPKWKFSPKWTFGNVPRIFSVTPNSVLSLAHDHRRQSWGSLVLTPPPHFGMGLNFQQFFFVVGSLVSPYADNLEFFPPNKIAPPKCPICLL